MSKADDGTLGTNVLPEGERAIHVVCHDCPVESLVTSHCDLDDIYARAEAMKVDHEDAKGHHVSTLEVRG